MTKFEKLIIAEELLQEQGSYTMFQKSYTDARQFYDVETSIELALEQQGLMSQYLSALAEMLDN